jgi:hypothetical protein
MRTGAAIPLVLAATMAQGETDFTALSTRERLLFHKEIRAVLLAHPDLAYPALPPEYLPSPRLYRDEVNRDLDLIATHSAALFATDLPGVTPAPIQQRVAVFTSADCAACETAARDLETLSPRFGLRVYLIDSDKHHDLFQTMGADTLPFYVFPKMMLRGKMPAPVIQRYLEQGLGQSETGNAVKQ